MFGWIICPVSRIVGPMRKILLSRDMAKTLSYLVIHLAIGFTVAYAFTGSLAIASGIAMVEPLCNAVAYFIHEKAWNGKLTLKRVLEILAHRHPHPGSDAA